MVFFTVNFNMCSTARTAFSIGSLILIWPLRDIKNSTAKILAHIIISNTV